MSGIVIIEEDRLIRGLLVEWLTAEGYQVCSAIPRGIPNQKTPDLIIVDICMPRQEGAKMLRALTEAYPNTPMIATSTQFRLGSIASRTAAEALGVRRLIAKPFTQSSLLAGVHGIIGPAVRAQ